MACHIITSCVLLGGAAFLQQYGDAVVPSLQALIGQPRGPSSLLPFFCQKFLLCLLQTSFTPWCQSDYNRRSAILHSLQALISQPPEIVSQPPSWFVELLQPGMSKLQSCISLTMLMCTSYQLLQLSHLLHPVFPLSFLPALSQFAFTPAGFSRAVSDLTSCSRVAMAQLAGPHT